MTTRTPNLRGLIALARRDGVDIRPTLLRVITDLFVQEPVHSPTEVDRYVELARHMLDGVDEASRLAVAMKLARYPGAPREILLMLAADTIEVAELVLSQAHFGESDLLRLAEALDDERRRFIAGRKDLPAAIAARLGRPLPVPQAPAPVTPDAPRESLDATRRPAVASSITLKDMVAKTARPEDGAIRDVAEAAPPAASEWERPLGLKPVAPATAKPAPELPAWMTKPASPAPAAPAAVAPATAKPAPELPAWMTKPASPAPAAPAAVAPATAKPAPELPAWMTKPASPAPAAPAAMAPATAKPAPELLAWMTKPASPAPAAPAAAAAAAAKPAPELPAWMTKPATPTPAAPAATPSAAAKLATAPLPLTSWKTPPVATPAPALGASAPVAPPAAAERAARPPLASAADSALAITELEQAALQRKPEEFIDRLARIFDLDRAKAEEVVRDASGQSVAIACRALDMPCDVFSRIVLFLDPTIGRSVALVFSLAEYYGRMSVADANEVVASWRGARRAAPRHQPFTAADGAGRHSFEPRRATPPLPGATRVAARG